MKKICSICVSLILMCGFSTAFADDGYTPETERDKPPVVVDSQFDYDKQYFITSENVNSIKVIVPEMENKEIIFKTGKPYLDDAQRVRVSLRDVAEQLGYNVHWYSETGHIVVSNTDDWFTFTAEDNIVVCKPHFAGTDKNGNRISAGHLVMDCSPQIIDGVTYIPLRHVSNILYHNVVWEPDSLTAKLYNLSVISYGSGVVYYDVDPTEIS